MSIFDDIGKAFEDLYGYIKDGVEISVNTITDVFQKVAILIESTFIEIGDMAERIALAIKEVGITLSQGVIDGATIAIDYIGKNVKEAIETLIIFPEGGEAGNAPTPEYKLAISKAIASVFLKISVEGQEYDVFGILIAACNEKKSELLKLGANITAERVGNDIYNIPNVARAVVKKEALKEYIAWLIYKAATEKPQLMENSKAAQVATGIIVTAITTLLTEGKIADGAPAWPNTKGVTPDPIDPDATTVWTEGSRISINDAVYLVLDGKVRHIPNPETYINLFDNWDNIIKSEEGLQEIDEPLTNGAHLSAANGDPKVYLVADGVKRWIASPQVFKKYHFNDKAIQRIDAAKQNAIPTGNPIYQFTKREGARLDLKPGGGIHLLLDKTAHHIPNEETYNLLFKNWNNIQDFNAVSMKIGAPITNKAYLARSDDKVYFVNGGEKRWIMSPVAFNNFNFNWDKIKTEPAEKLDKIPTGKSIY